MQPRLWRAEETLPVKRYLMEYPALCQRRDALTAELERLRAATQRATARLDSARVQTSRNPSSGEDAVLRVIDGEVRLQEIIAHIGEALAARLCLLEALPDERQKTLLTLRYISGIAWERIGYTMHYERTQVFEIHNQALRAAQVVLDGLIEAHEGEQLLLKGVRAAATRQPQNGSRADSPCQVSKG